MALRPRVLAAGLVLGALASTAAAATGTLARPDLSGMEPPVRKAIEELQAHLDALAADDGTPDDALAVAYHALGEVYHAHGLTESAGAVYLESLRLNPENERAAYYLGCLQHQNGELEEAATVFESLLDRQGGDPALLIRLGNVRLELAQAERARGFFERALEADPTLAAAHYGLGRCAAAAGETERAVEHFEKALELQPEATVVHYPLALAHRRLGNLDQARRHLERHGPTEVTFPDPGLERLSRIAATSAVQVVLSLAADRESFSARDYLGFTLGQLGKTVGSIEYLREVIARKRKTPAAGVPTEGQETELARIHYAVAGLLVLKGDDGEAIAELRAAVDLAPEFAEVRLMLANALARAGDFAAAVREYDRAIELDPALAEAWLKRSAVRMRLGEVERAAAELRRFTELEPEVAEGWLRLGAVLERLQDASGAAEAYEKAVGLELPDPEKAAAHRNLAALLRQQGELAAAIDHYELALRLDEGSIETRLDLAGALGHLDRYDEAAAQYARVAAAEPGHEAARLGEVSALVLSQRYEDAADRLRDAHRSLPESASVAHLLARFLAAAPEEALRDGPMALEISQGLFARRRSLSVGETMAMALAETGDAERAAELQRSLLAAAERAGAGDLVTGRLAANLGRYEEGLRCCADSGPAVLLPPPEASAEQGTQG